ncbi:Uncharacterised protein [Mycobacteroides abscessus subsp. abscessus]|uniref:Uncharacterized protein n=1 Tax=Mycobacteroides abscessus subsp. massiliense TaxID=1962118 RepID=A0A1T8M9R5_9MYCO|nr:hypothetical protein [Mycobacteroides abscessus]SKM03777.1 Uncharacterised protein [Mycobacteroides abscessus subsp. massiliense]EIC65307.1 hypothetical protein S7W_18480 [Mycobacteroides abscessus M94]MDM2320521.1 hypothetical protein [Mycobacteroides abscessus]MDM2322514.1 hypothetical protein [Mycobacteroides abscessus]MDM2326970.1 hypothetical protein [Mycobacteroides abscessus]
MSGPIKSRLVELTSAVAATLLAAGVDPNVVGFLAYDSVTGVLEGSERELLAWEDYDYDDEA